MKDDNTFGKILILSGCIMAFLLLCFYDTYKKKGDDILNKLQETIQTDLAVQKETPEDKVSKTDKKKSDGKESVNDQESIEEQKEAQEEKKQGEKTKNEETKNEETSSGDTQASDVENPLIRVLIKTDDYADEYHSSVTLQCSTDYVLQYGETTEEHGAAEALTLTADSPYLNDGILRIQPKDGKGEITLPGLKRGY